MPLVNRAVSGFPPGSTFKIVTALAGLHEEPGGNARYNCPGGMQYGDHYFHCWIAEKHGAARHARLADALKVSCDCFFYQYGNEAGIETIDHVGELLGPRQNDHELGLSGEKEGVHARARMAEGRSSAGEVDARPTPRTSRSARATSSPARCRWRWPMPPWPMAAISYEPRLVKKVLDPNGQPTCAMRTAKSPCRISRRSAPICATKFHAAADRAGPPGPVEGRQRIRRHRRRRQAQGQETWSSRARPAPRRRPTAAKRKHRLVLLFRALRTSPLRHCRHGAGRQAWRRRRGADRQPHPRTMPRHGPGQLQGGSSPSSLPRTAITFPADRKAPRLQRLARAITVNAEEETAGDKPAAEKCSRSGRSKAMPTRISVRKPMRAGRVPTPSRPSRRLPVDRRNFFERFFEPRSAPGTRARASGSAAIRRMSSIQCSFGLHVPHAIH